MTLRRTATAALAALALAPGTALALPSQAPRDGWVPDGGVSDVLELPGGRLLVGGSFTRWAPRTGPLAVVDRGRGALRRGALPELAGGAVTTLLPDGSGGWYVGGSFRYAGGKPRYGLARVLADGRIAGFRADVLGPDPFIRRPGRVEVIDRMADRLYVGGSFMHVGGRPRSGLAAIDAESGRVLDWAPAIDGDVQSMATSSSGAVYIAGRFSEVNGTPRLGLAAVDHATGALLPFDAQVNGTVNRVRRTRDRLLIAGSFTTAGGAPHRGIAALDPMTGAALDWSPALDGEATGVDVRGDDVVVTWRRNGDASGGVTCFDRITGAVRWSTTTAGRPDVVRIDEETVRIAGAFRRVAGQPRMGAAALRLHDGTLARWNPRPLVPRLDFFAGVSVLVRDGGRILMGGSFQGVGGVPRRGLAVLDRATLRPTARRVDQPGNVSDLLDAFGRIYVVGGIARVTRLDYRAGVALDPQTLRRVPWRSPTFRPGWPSAIAAIGDRLVVTGAWNGVGKTTIHGSLAALRPDTGALVDWGPPKLAANGVSAVVEANGRVWAVGDWSGVTLSVAELDPQTGEIVRTPLDNVESGDISAFEPAQGTTAYVGGAVERIGRSRVRGIARVDLATGRVLPWGASTGGNAYDVQVIPGAVLVAGQIYRANGRVRVGVAAFAPRTGHLLPWDPDLDGTAGRVLRLGDDVVILGGFTSVGPHAQPYVAFFPPA